MEDQSSRLIRFIIAILLCFFMPYASASPTIDHQEKRKSALAKLIDLNPQSSDFKKHLTKVVSLYEQHMKKLRQLKIDKDTEMLLGEAEEYHKLIQTGALSYNSMIENLKHEHNLMTVIEQRLSKKLIQSSAKDLSAQTVTIAIGEMPMVSGANDHSPGKKIRQNEDLYDASISIPVHIGNRHGFDKLNKDE